MKNLLIRFFCAAAALAFVFSSNATNWPGWRGPSGTGVTPEKDLPLKWSTNENVRWRSELPEAGNSSPIIWGKRVFVAQAVQKENRRTLMCFDRASGKLLWQSGVTYTEHEQTQEDNPYCSGTPATDGERIYVCFGSAGVFAYDFEAKRNGIETWESSITCSAMPFLRSSMATFALLIMGPIPKRA